MLTGLTASAGLAACGRKGEGKLTTGRPHTLDAAVMGAWRAPADRARDAARHPRETLEFWGLKPGMTVVEVWPGAGWWTDIIAPFLAGTGGRLIVDQLDPAETGGQAGRQVVDALNEKLKTRKALFGAVQTGVFSRAAAPLAPAGSADLVVFERNIAAWMAAGLVEKAFRDAFAALKPGGALGVEEPRADPGGVQDPVAASGYVQQAYVTRLAQEAGFKLEEASEINANPKDTKDHPFGVWTLPPARLSAPIGQPADPSFNHARYDAIGEPDQMTLRLRKPG